MRRAGGLLLLLVLAAPAQDLNSGSRAAARLEELAPGTLLPVSLDHTLRAGSSAGKAITARTTQRVPLPNNEYLTAGVQLQGTITASSRAPDSLHLEFTRIAWRHASLPIAVRALAIANFVIAGDTKQPANGATDRGNSNPANWTTRQVGEDEVARSGWSGPVVNKVSRTIGFADYDGVYAAPAEPGTPALALGVFSSSAHGLFGFAADCDLASGPASVTLQCAHSRLVLHRGDNLLLEVLAAP